METVFFKKVAKVQRAVTASFIKHKRRLRRLAPGADIQHVGGTAVTRCLTKGDLDIQVRVPADQFAAAKRALLKHYKVLPGGFSAIDAISFKDDRDHTSVGVHLTVIGGSGDIQWKFREVLLARPDLCEAYDALKKRYHGKSMAAYRNAKVRFFAKLRRTPEYRALDERQQPTGMTATRTRQASKTSSTRR